LESPFYFASSVAKAMEDRFSFEEQVGDAYFNRFLDFASLGMTAGISQLLRFGLGHSALCFFYDLKEPGFPPSRE